MDSLPGPAWTSPSSRWQSWTIGATAGLLNGLIAIGGGILVTPFLVAYRRLPLQVAVGTSLVMVVLLSTIGLIGHAIRGNLSVEVSQLTICALGGIFGAALGSKVLAALTPRWLMKAFAVFLFVVAARLIGQGLGTEQFHTGFALAVPWVALLAIGVFTGVLSTVFGVGGGALALLALATVYSVPLKEGLPLALALNVSNALSGVFYHARDRTICPRELIALVPTAVAGVMIGVGLAHVAPSQALRVVFGFVLLLLAVRVVRDT